MKPLLIYGVRLTLTLILLAWLASQVDLRAVGAVLAQANPAWLALGVAINLLSIICATWRWQVLLTGLNFRFRLLQLLRLVLSGAFFNMFLPSSVGGDVVKMVLIAPDLDRREDAVSSVLMDRVVGLAVTIAVGLTAVLLLPSVWDNAALLVSLGLILVAFSCGLISLFSRPLLDLIGRIMPGAIWRRAGPPVLRVHLSLMLMARRPMVLLKAAAISVLRQFAICLSVYCAGESFGLGLSPIAYFAAVPIAIAITALPIAINGLGLQDNALLLLLAGFGLTAAEALSLSVFLHVLRNGTGLLGGVVFALTRRGRSAAGAGPAPLDPLPAPRLPPKTEGRQVEAGGLALAATPAQKAHLPGPIPRPIEQDPEHL